MKLVEGAVEAFVVGWHKKRKITSCDGGECADCVGGGATMRYILVAATVARLLVRMACTIFDRVPQASWRSFVL